MGKCVANNCTYTINTLITPQLNAFSLTSSGLSLSVSNYQNITVNVSSIEIEFANSICTVTAFLNGSITCVFPRNPDNSLQIEAGSYIPTVHFDGIGFATYNSTLTNAPVPLLFSALNTTSVYFLSKTLNSFNF